MPNLSPLLQTEAPEKVQKTYGRIQELLETDSLPEPFLVYGRVEPFLKDFYMNFKKFVYSKGKLDAQTKSLIALAISSQANCQPWTDFFVERCKELELDKQKIEEVLAVSATCEMYNVFFKFRHLAGSDVFSGMSVGLRAHTFNYTSLDEKTVEIINVIISDVNGCEPCTSGHVDALRKLDLPDEAILEGVQCAATMKAGVQFLKSAGY